MRLKVIVSTAFVALFLCSGVAVGQTGCLRGWVWSDSNADPIDDAVIELYTDPFEQPVDSEYTDADGMYRFTAIPVGTYYVHASASGYMAEWYDDKQCPDEADPVVVHPSQLTDSINFGLAPEGGTGGIRGMVYDDQTGAPINDAVVKLYTDPFGEPIDSTYSASNGIYLFDGLDPGTYYLYASASGYVGEWYHDAQCPGDADPVVVHPGQITDHICFGLTPEAALGCIRGWVWDDVSGDPINDALVELYTDPFGSPIWSTHTDGEGMYLFQQVPAGVYYVRAAATGFIAEWWDDKPYPCQADPVVVHPGQLTDHIDFGLAREHHTGSISGRVTAEATGDPIAGAHVFAYLDPYGSPVADTHTYPCGSYFLEDLAPGTYYVYVEASGYVPEWYDNVTDPAEATPVEVVAGEDTPNIDFALACCGPCLISGEVVDEVTGAPIANAFLCAVEDDGQGGGYAVTNQHGEYTIRGLEPVPHIVFAHAYGYIGEFYDGVYNWEEATPVTPPADNINFSLHRCRGGPGRITGFILKGSKGPVEGACVYAYQGNSAVGFGTSGMDGCYMIAGLQPGTYTIRATRVGYRSTNYRDPVPVGERITPGINVYMPPVGIEDLPGYQIPDTRCQMLESFPNPFSRSATISYTVQRSRGAGERGSNLSSYQLISLCVYDLSGRLVRVLVDGTQEAGAHEAVWNGDDSSGSRVPSGLYFCRLATTAYTATGRILVVR